jgi:hypothetical protein
MARKRTHRTRLYIDVKNNIYWNLKVTIAKMTIDHILVRLAALEHAKRGYPWSCWLAEAIMDYAKEHPEAFPHKVLYAYVTASVVYLVDKIDGQPTHAFKYKHNFSSIIMKFDGMTTAQQKKEFIESIGGEDLLLKLFPGRKRRFGSHAASVGSGGKGRSKVMSYGAKRRAIAAGLMPDIRQSHADLYSV